MIENPTESSTYFVNQTQIRQKEVREISCLVHTAPDHSRGFCISGAVRACQCLERSGRLHNNFTEEAAVYYIQFNYQGATANATTFGRFTTALIYKLSKFIRLRNLQ